MDNIYALGKLFTSEWTDKVSGQISRHIFLPNWGYCWYMLHIHISYTSYQKGNVLVLRKRLMNDLKLFFLVKVPLATRLHQWNTVGFLQPWLVRIMKDQAIRHGTLQVSNSNRMLLHLYLTNELQTTFATTLHHVVQSLYYILLDTKQLLNSSILVFILKGSADHGRPYSSVEYSQLPFIVAT